MQAVRIKYNRYGIELIMNPTISFEDLLESIRVKFFEGDSFFQNAGMAIIFSGRTLSLSEEDRIITMIEAVSHVRIICVIEENALKEALIRSQLERFTGQVISEEHEEAGVEEAPEAVPVQTGPEPVAERPAEEEAGEGVRTLEDDIPAEDAQVERTADEDGTQIITCKGFYKGNIAAGEVLVSDGQLIILGDVQPGAGVMAEGNIIVFGSLKGNAYAGARGGEDCIVAAFDLDPGNLRIGQTDYIREEEFTKGRGFGRRKKERPEEEFSVAFCRDGIIAVEGATRALFDGLANA